MPPYSKAFSWSDRKQPAVSTLWPLHLQTQVRSQHLC